MSSNLIDRLGRIRKELVALKAGFSGDEKRFFGSVATTKNFNITTDVPLTIVTDFEFTDFPQLYATVYREGNPFPLGFFVVARKSLYEWRVYVASDTPEEYDIECVLISEQTPTVFDLVADS